LKINNREYLLAGILSLVLIGGFNNVFAVSTINFDDKTAPVTPINSDYQDDGAIFSSASYVLTIIDDSGETPGPPSTPNILLSNFGPNNGDIIISVVDPSTHVPTDASSISFKLFSVGNNAVTVVAKDSSDSVIDTQVFQHNDVGGPNCNYPTEWPSGCPGPITNGWAQTDSYSFSGNIRTVTITSSQAVEGDGYGIDDVLVTFPPANQDPLCTATSNVSTLWPPNHKMVAITLSGEIDPDGDITTLTVTGVTQDEPTNGLGDGDTPKDAKYPDSATNPGPLQVRSERSGLGDGRIYVISYNLIDGKGGSCDGSVTVGVPHDQSKPITVVDSGQNYDSTS
jgi:hypothetical protein